MQLTNRTKIKIESVEERDQLLNCIKESGMEVVVYSEEEFTSQNWKMPFNDYIHICECRPLSDISIGTNYGKSTHCQIIDGRNPRVVYYVPLIEDSYYEVSDEIKNECDSAKSASARVLRGIVRKVEKQFHTKVSVDKVTSRQWMPHVETPSPFKNKTYDGQTVEHVYGYDLNSAYSYYIKQFGLNWCTVPGVDYHGQEAEINAAINTALCEYIDKWFHIKSTKTGEEKAHAKKMLNLITGHIRNINPVAYEELKWGVQRKIIDPLMETCGQPVIYSNVDSIYTIGESAVLNAQLGTAIGQFKLEHKDCRFTWQLAKLNYQINDDPPVARGIPKSRYAAFLQEKGRPFILNKDTIEPVHYYTIEQLLHKEKK